MKISEVQKAIKVANRRVFIVTKFGWVEQVKSYVKPILQAQKKSRGNIDIDCHVDEEKNFMLLR
jgi:hypothetical protein